MDVGDLITLEPRQRRVAAVVTGRMQNNSYLECVFLDAHDVPVPSGYADNRCWKAPELYGAQPLTNPTDEQLAAAMHIMLTGYVPGVDDE